MEEIDPFDQLGPVQGPLPGFMNELGAELDRENNLADNNQMFGQPVHVHLHDGIGQAFNPNLPNQNEIRDLDEEIDLDDEGEGLPLLVPGRAQRIRAHFAYGKYFQAFCLVIYAILNFVLRFIVPSFSLFFTAVASYDDPDHYTLDQILIILFASVTMLIGFQYALVMNAFRRNANNVAVLFLAFANFSMWDKLHDRKFFEIPAAEKDLVYLINYYEFYLILTCNMLTILFLFLFLVCLLVFLLVKALTQSYKLNKERRILHELEKIKLRSWKQAHPDKAAKLQSKENEVGEHQSAFFCCICYSSVNDESMMVELPDCGHLFHHKCVMDWLNKNPKCPYCRENVIDMLKRRRRTGREAEGPIDDPLAHN
jgi:hypothetical protein